VAAPLWDYQGNVVAAISATTVIASWAPARLATMVERVLDAARAISQDIGWIDPATLDSSLSKELATEEKSH
jgi:DNA-binding IclR family transcriptional regulator